MINDENDRISRPTIGRWTEAANREVSGAALSPQQQLQNLYKNTYLELEHYKDTYLDLLQVMFSSDKKTLSPEFPREPGKLSDAPFNRALRKAESFHSPNSRSNKVQNAWLWLREHINYVAHLPNEHNAKRPEADFPIIAGDFYFDVTKEYDPEGGITITHCEPASSYPYLRAMLRQQPQVPDGVEGDTMYDAVEHWLDGLTPIDVAPFGADMVVQSHYGKPLEAARDKIKPLLRELKTSEQTLNELTDAIDIAKKHVPKYR